jgi:hypothetical protein
VRARSSGIFLLLGSLWCSPAAAQAIEAEPAPASPPLAEPVAPESAAERAPAPTPPPAPEPPPAAPPQAAPAPVAAPPTRSEVEAPVFPKPSRFFAHLALGGGYFHASSGAQEDRRTFSGGTFSAQLAMGGRVGRKTLIGGAYLHDEVLGLSSNDEVIDGDEPTLKNIGFSLWAIGFFADIPVHVEPGLHFQMLLGIGTLAVSREESDTDNPNGLLVNLGVGYDLRVGQHLALGALLRASYSPQDVDENSGTSVLVFAPALLLTATTR